MTEQALIGYIMSTYSLNATEAIQIADALLICYNTVTTDVIDEYMQYRLSN